MAESFEVAFDGLFDRAYRLAYRILGDGPAAEDVAAEALARAYADWAKISDLDYRDAWVMRVASNLAIDVTRRKPRHQRAPAASSMDEQVVLRVALGAALRALPKRQRESVSLRYLADLREAEVASLLGVSVGSVKTHVSRGLASLRAQFGDSFKEARSV